GGPGAAEHRGGAGQGAPVHHAPCARARPGGADPGHLERGRHPQELTEDFPTPLGLVSRHGCRPLLVPPTLRRHGRVTSPDMGDHTTCPIPRPRPPLTSPKSLPTTVMCRRRRCSPPPSPSPTTTPRTAPGTSPSRRWRSARTATR